MKRIEPQSWEKLPALVRHWFATCTQTQNPGHSRAAVHELLLAAVDGNIAVANHLALA